LPTGLAKLEIGAKYVGDRLNIFFDADDVVVEITEEELKPRGWDSLKARFPAQLSCLENATRVWWRFCWSASKRREQIISRCRPSPVHKRQIKAGYIHKLDVIGKVIDNR
jgi:hypothetical protein